MIECDTVAKGVESQSLWPGLLLISPYIFQGKVLKENIARIDYDGCAYTGMNGIFSSAKPVIAYDGFIAVLTDEMQIWFGGRNVHAICSPMVESEFLVYFLDRYIAI